MQGETFLILKRHVGKNVILYILLSIIILSISFLSSVATPEVLRRIVETIIESQYNDLSLSILFFAVVVLLTALLKSFNTTITFAANKKAVYNMENRFLKHYSGLKYWSLVNPSNTLALIRQNTTAVTSEVNSFIFGSLQLLFSIVFTVIYAVMINWAVLLICIAVTGIMMLVSQKGVSKIPAMSEQLTNNRNRLHAISWEHIKNTEIAGLLNTKRTVKGYVHANEEYLSNWLSLKKIYNRTELFSMFGGKIMILLIALFGGAMSIYGKIRLPDIFALVIVIPIICASFFDIPKKLALLKQLKGKFSAMDEFFNTGAEDDSKNNTSVHDRLDNLRVIDLSYKYPGQEKNALEKISLDFSQGLVCVAGQSGCGKSTLLRVCARLLPCDEGKVLWNETDVKQYNRKALWKRISYLDQNPRIIPGTLLYNITLGREVKDHESRLAKAVKDAGLTEFLKNNAGDITMEIDSSQLSNGELQKICFARVFYGEYDVLLLDEATSALDPSVELSTIAALKQRIFDEGISVIAVTHKVKFLENANEIVLLENGKVEGTGTHDSLIKSSKNYKKLLSSE